MNNNVGIFVPSCSCGRLFLFGHSYGTLCRAVGNRGTEGPGGAGWVIGIPNFVPLKKRQHTFYYYWYGPLQIFWPSTVLHCCQMYYTHRDYSYMPSKGSWVISSTSINAHKADNWYYSYITSNYCLFKLWFSISTLNPVFPRLCHVMIFYHGDKKYSCLGGIGFTAFVFHQVCYAGNIVFGHPPSI